MSANTVPKKIDITFAMTMLNARLADLNSGSATPLRLPEDLAACEYDPAAMQRIKQCIDYYMDHYAHYDEERAVRATEMRFALLLKTHIMHADSGPRGAHPRLLEQMITDDPDLVRCYTGSAYMLFGHFSTSLLAMDVFLQKEAAPKLAKPNAKPIYDGLVRAMIMRNQLPELLARAIWRHNDDELTELRTWLIGEQPLFLEAKLATLEAAKELRNTIQARNEALPAFAGAGIIKQPVHKKSAASWFNREDGDKSLRHRMADMLGTQLDPLREPLYIEQKTQYLDWLIPKLTATIPNYAGRPEHEELTQRLAEAEKEQALLRPLQPAAQPDPAPAPPAPGGGHAPGGAPGP